MHAIVCSVYMTHLTGITVVVVIQYYNIPPLLTSGIFVAKQFSKQILISIM